MALLMRLINLGALLVCLINVGTLLMCSINLRPVHVLDQSALNQFICSPVIYVQRMLVTVDNHWLWQPASPVQATKHNWRFIVQCCRLLLLSNSGQSTLDRSVHTSGAEPNRIDPVNIRCMDACLRVFACFNRFFLSSYRCNIVCAGCTETVQGSDATHS